MKLSDLRTPPPLRDSDYAAIRARVMAEITHDRQRRPFWRLAFALAAMVVAVLLFIPHREETSREERASRSPSPPLVAVVPAPAPAETTGPTTEPPKTSVPAPPLRSTSNQQPATSNRSARAARVAHRAPPQPPRHESIAAVPMSIEIHTADPDVRIIWIVSNDNTREES